jgi:hypothetical protein
LMIDADGLHNGYTPLTRLLRGGSRLDVVSCMDELLERADPVAVDEAGRIPIFEAIRNFEDPVHCQLAEKILSRGGFTRVISQSGGPSPDNYPVQWRGLMSDERYEAAWPVIDSDDFYNLCIRVLPTDVRYPMRKAIMSASTKKALGRLTSISTSFNDRIVRVEILEILKARQRLNLPSIELPQVAIQMLLEQSLQVQAPALQHSGPFLYTTIADTNASRNSPQPIVAGDHDPNVQRGSSTAYEQGHSAEFLHDPTPAVPIRHSGLVSHSFVHGF